MDKIISNLKQWIEKGYAPPEEVQIYPTNKCNLKCIFCYQTLNQYDLNSEIQKKRWLKIAEELCELGVKKILISGGGEPLTRPEITIPLMEVFKKNNVKGRLINNGTTWTDETIRKVIEIGWDHITFSVDGPDSKTHDYLRGINGCFKKIIKNIKLFKKYKTKLNKEKPILELVTVLCKTNYKKIPEMIELTHKLSIKHYNVEPVCVNNEDVIKIKLNKNERKEFLNDIIPKTKRLAENYGIFTNFHKLINVKCIERTGELKKIILNRHQEKKENKKFENKNPFLNLPCYEPWTWPKIEANGEVWPCSTVPLKVNIRNRSFKDIWYGSEFNKFRERIMKNDLPESCENCVLTHLEINSKIKKRLIEYEN